jgi:membrane protein
MRRDAIRDQLRMYVRMYAVPVRRVHVVDILWRAAADFARDAGTVYAAAMTYYVLLSIFPLLIVVVSVFGVVARDPDVQERVVDAIVRQIPDEVNLDQQVRDVVAGVAGSSTSLLGVLGLLFAVWTASGMFAALRRALNAAFDVPMARPYV